eukprot:103020-Pelagomonas_calceolata.AAC.1
MQLQTAWSTNLKLTVQVVHIVQRVSLLVQHFCWVCVRNKGGEFTPRCFLEISLGALKNRERQTDCVQLSDSRYCPSKPAKHCTRAPTRKPPPSPPPPAPAW